MDARVDVAADESAAGHDHHAQERHVAVGRAKAKVRVEQNEDRPDDAEHHVGLEPAVHRTEETEPRCALARRIQEQQQHETAADDAEHIAQSRARRDVALRRQARPDVDDEYGHQKEHAGRRYPAARLLSGIPVSAQRRGARRARRTSLACAHDGATTSGAFGRSFLLKGLAAFGMGFLSSLPVKSPASMPCRRPVAARGSRRTCHRAMESPIRSSRSSLRR